MQRLRSSLETTLRLLGFVESTQSPVSVTWPSSHHQLQLVLNAAVAPWAMRAMAAGMMCLASMVCGFGRIVEKCPFSVQEALKRKDGWKCFVRETGNTDIFVLG